LAIPIGVLLTPGQVHDRGRRCAVPQMEADTVMADKAFDADAR